jgi:hypothetical protein
MLVVRERFLVLDRDIRDVRLLRPGDLGRGRGRAGLGVGGR